MAVENQQLKIDPYTSTVPLVQLPVQEMSQNTRPAQPLQGQFGGHRGSGGLAIGDSILKGIMQGHQMKEQKKYQQATATIAAADKSVEDSYNQYQDALATGKDKAATDAAYANYTDQFNRAKAAKAQFVLPEKPAKGASGGKKKGVKDEAKSFGGGIKDFFAANPHIVPQIALMTMQPKPPGASSQTTMTQNQLQEQKNQLTLQGQGIERGKTEAAEQADKTQREAAQRAVEASGGIDAVLADKSADPKLQQAAREMKFTALDKESPEGKMKLQGYADLQSGKNKEWTPEQRALYGALGVVPEPKLTEITGKNGHLMQVSIDPLTNQPVAGSKLLDLGPPQWASEFYAKEAAEKAKFEKAVRGDPTSYGITLTGNKAQDAAAISARIAQLQIRAQYGIMSLADMTGKTGYEIQRNNGWLQDVTQSINSMFTGKKPDATVDFDWPGGQKVALNKEQANQILNQFVTDPNQTGGVMTFRDTPEIWPGKDAGAVERDRQWAYQLVRNRLMAQKGKNALTMEQADTILANTALGRPLGTSIVGGMTAAPQRPEAAQAASPGAMTPPPEKNWLQEDGLTDADLNNP
jgi:hypothetical protein